MSEKGFTLLEVLAAMLIFALLLAGIGPTLITQAQQVSRSELRNGAVEAAQQKLDELRLSDPTLLPASGSTDAETIEINGRDYSVRAHYCETAAFCQSSNNRHIRIEVSHSNEVIFDVETVFTLLR